MGLFSALRRVTFSILKKIAGVLISIILFIVGLLFYLETVRKIFPKAMFHLKLWFC